MKPGVSRTRARLSLHRGLERVGQRRIPRRPDLRNKVALRRAVIRSRMLDGRYSRVPVARWSVLGLPDEGLQRRP